MSTRTFTKLGNILDRDNWRWLQDNAAEIAEAIEAEVQAGAMPEDIRRYMLEQIGEPRTAFINRCVSASRFLKSRTKGNG